jgi:glucan phosphoethanolaminetransferase (alkaline phosphatase superfamily)
MLLVEVGAVAVAAAAFLFAYVRGFSGPASAIAPHLELVFSLACAVAGMRIAARRLLSAPISDFVAAALLASWVLVLFSYYALTLVGLASWGRVISWLLIKSYAPQISPLLAALGYHPWLVYLGASTVVLCSFVLSYLWIRRFDWASVVAARGTPALLWVAILALVSIGVSQAFAWTQESAIHTGEPVSLTLFPDHSVTHAQNHRDDGDRNAIRADAEARRTYAPASIARRPNIILVVGDGLRADHLGVLGYARPTTPFLQSVELTGSMRKASQMRSVCGESTCGLMGIAKSTYADSLYLRGFSLSEVLKLHGYRTRMILGGDHTNFYGLRTAFGAIDEFFDGSMAGDMYINDDRLVLREVASLPEWDGTPQYIQFHLMSSHGSGLRFLPPRHLPEENFYTRVGRPRAENFKNPMAVNYYDNGVLQTDWVISRITAMLTEKGYLDDALLLVTGDHGDLLGEFGEYGHAHSVREGALRVPFLMLGFGRAPSRFVDPDLIVSQVDIAPTLVYELGIPAPSNWQGLPLQRQRRRDTIPFQQRLQVGAYDATGVDPIWKYVLDLRTGDELLARITQGVEFESPVDEIEPARLNRLRAATVKAASGAYMLGTE